MIVTDDEDPPDDETPGPELNVTFTGDFSSRTQEQKLWVKMKVAHEILARMGLKEQNLAHVSLGHTGTDALTNVLSVKFTADVGNDAVAAMAESLNSQAVDVKSVWGGTSHIHSTGKATVKAALIHREIDEQTWAKVYLWVQAKTEEVRDQYRCLKRFGARIDWTVAVNDLTGPAEQFCTPFYIYRLNLAASSPQGLVDNAFCTRDGWCIEGAAVASQRSYGSAKRHLSARATRFEMTDTGQAGSVRVYLNTKRTSVGGRVAQKGANKEEDGWQCIAKFSGEYEEDSLKVTPDLSDCAAVFIGWSD